MQKNTTSTTTPVLFMIFNRLDTAEQVFAQIRNARPTKLYLAADGPRASKPGEADLCKSVREKILSMIDWECELKTLFREENLGCKRAVRSAISWLFENESEGIILEDDCVPMPTFFAYCEKALEKYRDNPEVMMVSGTNYIPTLTSGSHKAFLSRYYTIWGWATWKRAWDLYDPEMETWKAYKKSGALKKVFPHLGTAALLSSQFDSVAAQKVDTWDYQWFYTCAKNNGFTVVAPENLISNVGTVGSHARGNYSKFRFMQTTDIDLEKLTFPEVSDFNPAQDYELIKEVGLVSPTFWWTLLIKKLRAIKKGLLKKK